MKNKVYDSLYHKLELTNKVLDYYEKFAKKYGFLVLLSLFIFRQFSGDKTDVKTDWTQQIVVIIAPFLVCIGIIFIFALLEAHLEGYYLNKYSEEYREKYGYSEFDWSEGDN